MHSRSWPGRTGQRYRGGDHVLSKMLRLCLESLVLGLGAFLVIKGEMTAGMMIAGSILMGRVLSPIDQSIAVWKQWSTPSSPISAWTACCASPGGGRTDEPARAPGPGGF